LVTANVAPDNDRAAKAIRGNRAKVTTPQTVFINAGEALRFRAKIFRVPRRPVTKPGRGAKSTQAAKLINSHSPFDQP
jgi:uncharacterized Fe-S cluster protein YjdI